MKYVRAAMGVITVLTSGAGAAQVPTSTADIIRSTAPPERSEIQQSDAALRDLVTCVIRYQPTRTRNSSPRSPAPTPKAPS